MNVLSVESFGGRWTVVRAVLLVVALVGAVLWLAPVASAAAPSPPGGDEELEQLAASMDRLVTNLDDKTGNALPELAQLREKLARLVDLALVVPRYNAEAEALRAARRQEPVDYPAAYAQAATLQGDALLGALEKLVDLHTAVKYGEARRYLFLQIDNEAGVVEDAYTGRTATVTDQVPANTDMNLEHTWPQSLGATGVAKSDMHHLFCTDTKANGIRGSQPFGFVKDAEWQQGGSKSGGGVFEVRPQHRGNTARAMFYFALRYGKRIRNPEEAVLRQWNAADPVDDAERTRNDQVFAVQRNRNPFIDHPEFVEKISDF